MKDKDDNNKDLSNERNDSVYDKLVFAGLLILLLVFSVNALRLNNISKYIAGDDVAGYVASNSNVGSTLNSNIDVITKGVPDAVSAHVLSPA